MKITLAALVIFTVASSAFGVCTNIVSVNAPGINDVSTAGFVFVTLDATSACGQVVPAVSTGDMITLVADGKQFMAKARTIKNSPGKLVQVEAITVGDSPAEDAATLEQLATDTVAKVTIGSTTLDATILNVDAPLLNISRYSWSIGPATKEKSSGTPASTVSTTATATAPDDGATGAMAIKYDGEYARPGFLGRGNAQSQFQTRGTLSINTTNSDSTGFIDNNRVTAGIRSVSIPMSDLLAQTQVGIEGQLTKTFHHDLHDGAVMATVSTWIPALRSLTIFSSIPDYISPPLTVSLSYGYRNTRTTDARAHGRGGDATANYYLYAFDKYQLSFSGKWTLNDYSDRPPTIPRTQKLYKVSIAYLESPAAGFKVVTSYENGSIGPLLTKVRQYFVGIAATHFSMPGLSGGSK